MTKSIFTSMIIGFMLSACSPVLNTSTSENTTPTPAAQANQPTPAGTPTTQTDENVAAGSYTDYSPEAVTQATTDGRAILFFHADWCPTCRVADEEFSQNIDQIPPGVTVFKTDYDQESELKDRYAITYQHTFVEIDKDGNMIQKWNGGGIDQLLTKLEG